MARKALLARGSGRGIDRSTADLSGANPRLKKERKRIIRLNALTTILRLGS
jgi:hypothetical protein